MSLKRILLLILVVLIFLLLVMFGGGLWFASSQLLSPVLYGVEKDLSVCKPETAKAFGKDCGNLRTTHEFQFSEVKIPSTAGYNLPGWLIKAEENGKGPAVGAIMLVHAGGSDRREETKYIQFFLNRNIDVLTFDYSCHGEAPCTVPGMSYGDRESGDVLAAYQYLINKYEKVYAMGTSVGASAILIALPEMPKLTAVISDAPMVNFQRLIREAPQAQSSPKFFMDGMINLAMVRGKFDGQPSPEQSLLLTKTTPIFFIHSKADKVVSYRQSQDLANEYTGPKTVWIAEKGDHAAIWDVDHAEYEKRLTDFLNSIQ